MVADLYVCGGCLWVVILNVVFGRLLFGLVCGCLPFWFMLDCLEL